MARGALVEATPEHIDALVLDARPADIAELWAQSRLTPGQAMADGLRRSVFALTGLVDDQPACMFGVVAASALGGVGAPWMIGSQHLERHQLLFLRACRPVVAEMNRVFPVLRNQVDARNALAVRWLRWLGFTIHPAIVAGPDRLPFHPFERRAHV